MLKVKTTGKIHDTLTGYDFREDDPLTPMRAIRKKCLECCAGSSDEVKRCEIYDCALWPLRSGKSGNRKNLTPEQREALSERMKKRHRKLAE